MQHISSMPALPAAPVGGGCLLPLCQACCHVCHKCKQLDISAALSDPLMYADYGSIHGCHPCAFTGDSTSSALPDLAATLQALAVSGPGSASGDAGNAPDLEATLRAAAAAASASGGAASGDDNDDLLSE